jgi:hypothetical protein
MPLNGMLESWPVPLSLFPGYPEVNNLHLLQGPKMMQDDVLYYHRPKAAVLWTETVSPNKPFPLISQLYMY